MNYLGYLFEMKTGCGVTRYVVHPNAYFPFMERFPDAVKVRSEREDDRVTVIGDWDAYIAPEAGPNV